MNRNSAWGFILVAFISGLLIGVVATRQLTRKTNAATTPPEPTADRKTASPPERNRDSNAREDRDEMARLRQRIRTLEAQAKSPASPEEDSRKAEEIYKGMSSQKGTEDPKGFMRLTGQLADLRPSMTSVFVRKYREAKPRIDSIALELALASGGPDAGTLLKEIFGNPSTPKAERIVAGICLSGEGTLMKMANGIPPDPALVSLAATALGLTDPHERMAGVGLLGLQTSDQSRAALQMLVSQDKDEPVRMAALRVLQRNGDRSTLDYLLSYAAASFPELSLDSTEEEKLPPLAATLLRTISSLDRRFSEK